MRPRLPDWERRLSDFLAANADRPFEWGEWDCALFTASAIEAMTGEDPAAEFRAYGYSSAETARAAIDRIGRGTMIRTVNAMFPRRPKAFAQRGDIVMSKGALGICIGAKALFVGEQRIIGKLGLPHRVGLIPIDRSLWSRAWAV